MTNKNDEMQADIADLAWEMNERPFTLEDLVGRLNELEQRYQGMQPVAKFVQVLVRWDGNSEVK